MSPSHWLRIACLVSLLSPGSLIAGDIRVTVRVKYDTDAPAAGLQVFVRERMLTLSGPTAVDYPIGALNDQGELNNVVVRSRKQITVRVCRWFIFDCTNVRMDDPLDVPGMTIMVRHISDQSTFHSLDFVALYNTDLTFDIELPPWFSSSLLNPIAVGHFMRRPNLNSDFSADEQRTLAGLVLNYLNQDPELIRKHLREVDHLEALFSDHRSYIYELEKKLIRDGHTKFVPLPIWEPINTLPPNWEQTANVAEFTFPVLNLENRPRPQIDNVLRAERVCVESFPRARDLALRFGRTGLSAPTSYHLKSHAFLAGPFLRMSTAAAGTVFWPYHSLIVDLYDKWQSCKFGVSPDINIASYRDDGRPRMGLFRLGKDGRLWHSYQRVTVVRHNEVDGVEHLSFPVTFDHFSHWQQIENSPVITRYKVFTNRNGILVVLAMTKEDSLFTVQGSDEGWGTWTRLATRASDVVAVVGADEKMEIFATRSGTNGFELATAKETTAGAGNFGAFTRVASIPAERGLEVMIEKGQPLLYFINNLNQVTLMARRPDGTWSNPVQRSTVGATRIQVGRLANGSQELFMISAADAGIWRRRQILARYGNTVLQTWPDWERIGTTEEFTAMSLGTNAEGRLELFALGKGGQIFRASESFNAVWSGWREFDHQQLIDARNIAGGDRVRRLLGVTFDPDHKLRLVVLGRDGFMYMAEQTERNGPEWMGWTSL